MEIAPKVSRSSVELYSGELLLVTDGLDCDSHWSQGPQLNPGQMHRVLFHSESWRGPGSHEERREGWQKFGGKEVQLLTEVQSHPGGHKMHQGKVHTGGSFLKI